MTESTLAGEPHTQNQVSSTALKLVAIILMIAALTGSVFLLKWAITEKFSKFQTADSSQITAKIRSQQLACLAKNIYYEAGSEPFEGKVAVAQVTMNRSQSGKFPDDICKVVYQKDDRLGLCQFSWFCMPNTTIKPMHKENYDESMEVAKKVLLEGFRLPSLKEALYFHGTYINPGWNREKITVIGRHIFYK